MINCIKFFFAFSVLTSCQLVSNDQDFVVASVYDEDLKYSDIKYLLSNKPSFQDSLEYVDIIVSAWVKEQLMVRMAKMNLTQDQQSIEASVESYKNSLLIYEYQNDLISAKLDTIIYDFQLQDYYKKNKENFILSNDVGVINYIKLRKDVPQLKKFEMMFKKNTEDSEFFIEDYCLQFAEEYMFNDTLWLNLEQVVKKLPERSNAYKAQFKRKYFKTEDEHFYYFVYIKKYTPKGSVSPLQLVEKNIRYHILNKRNLDFLAEMENEIYKEALAKDHIKYEY